LSIQAQNLLICLYEQRYDDIYVRIVDIYACRSTRHRYLRSTGLSEKAVMSWPTVCVLVSCDELSLSILLTRRLLLQTVVYSGECNISWTVW